MPELHSHTRYSSSQKVRVGFTISGLIGLAVLLPIGATLAQTSDVNLTEKRKQYQELQDKATVYRENLKAKQQEKTTLSNQLEILDQNISLTETEIEKSEIEIEELGIEQDQLTDEIQSTQGEIDEAKDRIALAVEDLYSYGEQSFLEIALRNVSLSDFSSQVQYTETLNTTFQETLNELVALKREQKKNKQDLADKEELERAKKEDLAQQKGELVTEADSKTVLLDAVEQDEEKFQALVDQVRQEQIAIDAQITQAERKYRDRFNPPATPGQDGVLNPGGTGDELPTDFNPGWPLDSRRVTATFADPTYPYQSLFVHKAIDIGTPQGSQVRAADAGIVSVVRFDGTTNFAYIIIAHADGFTTLYGHVSQVYVQSEQVVQKGELIAASGATPGTIGAGLYTTGPHLHFEVSLNGIKVDPLMYLP